MEATYDVKFHGRKPIKNCTAKKVESFFPEINMRIFDNFTIEEIVMHCKDGGAIVISKRNHETV